MKILKALPVAAILAVSIGALADQNDHAIPRPTPPPNNGGGINQPNPPPRPPPVCGGERGRRRYRHVDYYNSNYPMLYAAGDACLERNQGRIIWRRGGGWTWAPIWMVSPDCESFTKCTDIDTSIPPQPSGCGASLGTHFEGNSGIISVNSTNNEGAVDLVSTEIERIQNCSLYALPAIRCAGNITEVQAYSDIHMVEEWEIQNPDCSWRVERNFFTTRDYNWADGRNISERVQQKWQYTESRRTTGVKLDQRVIARLLPAELPVNVSLRASWNKDQNASVDVVGGTRYFTYDVKQVSRNATTQEFTVQPVATVINSPSVSSLSLTDVVTKKDKVIIEKGNAPKLQIKDPEAKELARIDGNTTTSYIVRIESKHKRLLAKDTVSSFEFNVSNNENSDLISVDLSDKLAQVFFEGKGNYEVDISIAAVRVGNKYVSTNASSRISNLFKMESKIK